MLGEEARRVVGVRDVLGFGLMAHVGLLNYADFIAILDQVDSGGDDRFPEFMPLLAAIIFP